MRSKLVEKPIKMNRAKPQIEKELDVKMSNRGKEFFIEGEAESEYIAVDIMDAIDFGFPIPTALQIHKEDLIFERINIKDHAKNNKVEIAKGRVIGSKGKSLSTLTEVTGFAFEVKEKEVGIIGHPEEMKNVLTGVISIIRGAKHSNVYSFLQRNKEGPIWDLGLKEGIEKETD
ncbi:MAG: hypothetical protein ABEI74_01115 [Candidatus Pacearchaeota archaeon]